MAYGTAFGTTLTDLGRNLVASETTRNQLQAALAAAAAQENIARTAAGSSRYATDAQKQANNLNYALKIMEDERLRASTERQAGLTEQDIALRKAIGEKQYALNTPTETALNRESQLAIAKIVGEAEANRLNRVDPRYAQTELEINAETQKTIDALPGLEARANAESEALWNNRGQWFKLNEGEQRDYRTKAFQIPSNPTYGTFGNYLVPEVMPDGRVRFKAHLPALLRGRTAPVVSPTAGPTAALVPNAALNPAPDLMLKSKMRVAELMRRGFSEADAEFKAMAELPVSVRQNISGLLRGVAPLPEAQTSPTAVPTIRQQLPFANINPIQTDPDPETYSRPDYVPEPLTKVAGVIAANAPLRDLVPKQVFSNPTVRGGWQGGINTDDQAASFIQQYMRQLEAETVRLQSIIGQRGARERLAVVAREIQNIQDALKQVPMPQ